MARFNIQDLLDYFSGWRGEELRKKKREDESLSRRDLLQNQLQLEESKTAGALGLEKERNIGAMARERLAQESAQRIADITGGYGVRGHEIQAGAQRDVAATTGRAHTEAAGIAGKAHVEGARIGAASRQELAEASMRGRNESLEAQSRDRLEAAKIMAGTKNDPFTAWLETNPTNDPEEIRKMRSILKAPQPGSVREFETPTTPAATTPTTTVMPPITTARPPARTTLAPPASPAPAATPLTTAPTLKVNYPTGVSPQKWDAMTPEEQQQRRKKRRDQYFGQQGQ
jgi:hypothetical protein